MVARNNLDFTTVETWVIQLACRDFNGVPLTNVANVQLRITSNTAVLFDLSTAGGSMTFVGLQSAGIGQAVITPAQQIAAGIAPGVYFYEARAVLNDGSISDQSYGNIAVRQSLWRQFP